MINLLRVALLGVVKIVLWLFSAIYLCWGKKKKKCALTTIIIKLSLYKITFAPNQPCLPLCFILIFK